MKMLLKQKMFSWFDSYDIYDEAGEVLYTVKGELAFGHQLRIYDKYGEEVGLLKQKILTFLPKFELYEKEQYIGCIHKALSFFLPRFTIDFCGWQIVGDCIGWEYAITDALGDTVAYISQELNWTDTYSIDVVDSKDALYALMLVLAIDADKCSRKD